jgi:hypothetical protein
MADKGRLENVETGPSLPKKIRRRQPFLAEYKMKYPFLSKSDRGDDYAFCSICSSHFSVAHGGMNDCAIHTSGEKHKKYASIVKNQRTISSFACADVYSDLDHQVMSAELSFMNFLFEHDVPIAASDHAGELFRKMFPDSAIAKKYKCARTKTTCLIQHESRSVVDETVKECSVFALLTDGSNDKGDKFYPMLLTHLAANGLVQTRVLAVPTVKEASATGIVHAFVICVLSNVMIFLIIR